MLELAIWESKIIERFDRNNVTLTFDMTMQCRTDSVTMETIIVPNVMSFLTDGDDGIDVFCSDDVCSNGISNGDNDDDSDDSNEGEVGDENASEENYDGYGNDSKDSVDSEEEYEDDSDGDEDHGENMEF